jgi:cellulose biosynthesis protein BcsQ
MDGLSTFTITNGGSAMTGVTKWTLTVNGESVITGQLQQAAVDEGLPDVPVMKTEIYRRAVYRDAQGDASGATAYAPSSEAAGEIKRFVRELLQV